MYHVVRVSEAPQPAKNRQNLSQRYARRRSLALIKELKVKIDLLQKQIKHATKSY